MYKIVVNEFGPVENLTVTEAQTPEPGPGQVLVRMTSIGMNHAELMARRGEYKIASGDPPFVPGLEGGGVVEAVGPDVTPLRPGDRVILALDAPRRALGGEGTYQSHYLTTADKLVLAPDGIPDQCLGALWLAYLTAWGCLVWKQNLQPGQNVLIPAASSSVGLAAAQLCKDIGATAIGTTTSPDKVDRLRQMPEAMFDHIVVTSDRGLADEPAQPWWDRVKQITGDRRCDVIFDPVGAGAFVNSEIRLLGRGGTLWVYGLLGQTGTVDLSPLIRLFASVRGWALTELAMHGGEPLAQGYQHVLDRIADGRYKLPVADTFNLRDVQHAHAEMEKARHIGKLVLIP